jgi:hypothetical protein
MIKRNLGYTLAGRSMQSQNCQMLMMAVTHNLMILILFVRELFYRVEKRKRYNRRRNINHESKSTKF